MYLDLLLLDLEKRLSFLLKGKYWLWKITLVSILLFVVVDFSGNMGKLVYFKDFWNTSVKQQQLDTTHEIVRSQSEDYFAFFKKGESADISSYRHEAKMKFRLFLPTLVRIFGQNHFGLWLYLLALALGLPYLYLVAKMSLKILGEDTNRILVLLFVVGFGNLYAGGGSFILDIVPYGDFFAFFFLLISIYSRNLLAIFICCQCAFWVDERALINAVYVILWWTIIPFSNKEFTIKFSFQALTVFLSGVVYVGMRQYLIASHHLDDTVYMEEFIGTFYENLKMLSLRVWGGFDGFWLLVILGLVILFREKQYKFLLALSGSLIISTSFALIAFDANRGISYGFIVLLFSLIICKKYLSEKELKYVLLVCFLVSILSPTLNKYRISGAGQLM
jgi:hypothetical protein